MGTVIGIWDLAAALAWLRSNVGEQFAVDPIDEKPYELMGQGWYVFTSHKVVGGSTPYMPINIVRIDNKEKSIEFSLIFDKGI